MTRTTHRGVLTLAGALALGAMVAPQTACRGDRSNNPPRQFFPDMDDQYKWMAQSQKDFFDDGREMRRPVEGTVAFGVWDGVSDEPWAEDYNRKAAAILAMDDRVYTGADASGEYIDTIPVPVTSELIELGRHKYEIYCVACHGFQGDGMGTVGRNWSYPIPDYVDPTFSDPNDRRSKEGRIFHVIRHGVAEEASDKLLMPAYGHALDAQQAWAVVAYVKALQKSRTGTINEVPPAERSLLVGQLDDVERPAFAEGSTNGGER